MYIHMHMCVCADHMKHRCLQPLGPGAPSKDALDKAPSRPAPEVGHVRGFLQGLLFWLFKRNRAPSKGVLKRIWI